MAAKELVTQVKLQVPAGSANPAPPVGPALGQHGHDPEQRNCRCRSRSDRRGEDTADSDEAGKGRVRARQDQGCVPHRHIQ